MPVRQDPTPNPNAAKFTVGEPVGGPATYVKGSETQHAFADEILAIDEVISIFMTADFVTVTKTPDGDWEVIGPKALAILEAEFPA